MTRNAVEAERERIRREYEKRAKGLVRIVDRRIRSQAACGLSSLVVIDIHRNHLYDALELLRQAFPSFGMTVNNGSIYINW